MIAQVHPRVSGRLTAFLTRPLEFTEALPLGLAFLAAATVYCQIYCLLALQQMGGEVMPLYASIGRTSADVIPAFLAFELSKRVRSTNGVRQALTIVLIFVAAVGLGVFIRSHVHCMMSNLTPRRIAVDRLPALALSAAATFRYFRLRSRPPAQATEAAPRSEDLRIPPAGAIDWVKAAGNYVEVQAAGRTRLFRMTLREASASLPQDRFVQIHRSVIVSRDRIAKVYGRRRIEMNDGSVFPVGDAYRSNVTPS